MQKLLADLITLSNPAFLELDNEEQVGSGQFRSRKNEGFLNLRLRNLKEIDQCQGIQWKNIRKGNKSNKKQKKSLASATEELCAWKITSRMRIRFAISLRQISKQAFLSSICLVFVDNRNPVIHLCLHWREQIRN
ncbi:hypothetical protein FGO68_gene3971 [Halteria grandinella]|uniref:Uncharacterized protein n=1 Tax=Halteria grandinella TaxID=5974 RepID=A0A8J8SUY0_HALGN|nr:hypothetical protein FGO68_gene3971 [Halteria grandinella]